MTNSIPRGHQGFWPQSLPDCTWPCALMVWRDFVRRRRDEFLFSGLQRILKTRCGTKYEIILGITGLATLLILMSECFFDLHNILPRNV